MNPDRIPHLLNAAAYIGNAALWLTNARNVAHSTPIALLSLAIGIAALWLARKP